MRAFIRACSGVTPAPGRMDTDAVEGLMVWPRTVVLMALEHVPVIPEDPEA